jgi:hypothetical protein
MPYPPAIRHHVLGWAHRYEWNSPRLKQNRGAIKRAQSIKMQSTPADTLIAAHKELEGATKTGLMQTLAKAAQQVAGKDALDVSSTAQLRDICLGAARIFGWKGDSQVNVEVNNQVGVVVSEAKRREMQAQLRAIQDADDSEKHGCAQSHPSLVTNAATGERRHGKQPFWRACHSARFDIYYAGRRGRSSSITNSKSALGGWARRGRASKWKLCRLVRTK